MTVIGPFQSPVVKKVIFCFAIVNYFYVECHLLHPTATNNKSNLNLNLKTQKVNIPESATVSFTCKRNHQEYGFQRYCMSDPNYPICGWNKLLTCLVTFYGILVLMMPAFWLSGNVLLSGAGDLRFKSQAGQIELSAANGLPPLRHFFERSELCCLGVAMTRKWTPPTRYTLRCTQQDNERFDLNV